MCHKLRIPKAVREWGAVRATDELLRGLLSDFRVQVVVHDQASKPQVPV